MLKVMSLGFFGRVAIMRKTSACVKLAPFLKYVWTSFKLDLTGSLVSILAESPADFFGS